jgi:D-inositol-3-phosphate glycosyltransferase
MRILIVGPVAPYRSGVAMHTTALARAISARQDVECRVVSFKRQYPRLLYPGSDDRAPDQAPLIDPPTDFILDSVWPPSWARGLDVIRRFDADLIVMPAWTFVLAPCLGWLARALRKAGKPVVVIAHNVEDHDGSALKSAISRFQLNQATAFVAHNQALAEGLARVAPGRPALVHPHPIFEHYPDPTEPAARSEATELLFFGLVRPYKGLDIAVRALALTRRDMRLRIVGEFWDGLDETRALISSLNLDQRVEITPRYVSDAEAANYFAACDAVVLPYRTVSGSGVVPLAYRYGKPAVVTDLPGLAEVVRPGETGWVAPKEDPAALAALLDAQVSPEAAAAMAPAIARAREEMSWSRFAERVIAAGGL